MTELERQLKQLKLCWRNAETKMGVIKWRREIEKLERKMK